MSLVLVTKQGSLSKQSLEPDSLGRALLTLPLLHKRPGAAEGSERAHSQPVSGLQASLSTVPRPHVSLISFCISALASCHKASGLGCCFLHPFVPLLLLCIVLNTELVLSKYLLS